LFYNNNIVEVDQYFQLRHSTILTKFKKNGSIKNILRSKVYHNFLRPRSALNGKKPSETTGIKLDLSNIWEILI
jgi:hypothetical protein